jgi:hypothetical protein
MHAYADAIVGPNNLYSLIELRHIKKEATINYTADFFGIHILCIYSIYNEIF